MQWNLNRGERVEKRTAAPCKCFRTDGCKICNPDFHKKSLKFNYSHPDGQQSCPIVSLKNGGYAQSRAFENKQFSLALSAVSWNHHYSRIFTKQIECPRRLGVSKCQGSLRLETASKRVSVHNKTFSISSSGPLYIQTVPSTSTIRCMETQSKQLATDAMQQCWNKMFLPYAFDDDPHYIRSYQHKSNQFPPFSLSQRPRTPAFSGIQSHCNVIGLVPIWEFPGLNSQFRGTNHRCMRLRLPFVYRFLALTP